MSAYENSVPPVVIPRTLWYEENNNLIELLQDDLLTRTKPLIILGEAGMGKSHLLTWIASNAGYAHCTARQLINRHDPSTLLGGAQTLVIDALDEVSSQKDGDAVDNVLQKLSQLGCPNFVLACRVADWRSATGIAAIQEQYPDAPLELQLKPFDGNDATKFLSTTLGAESAKTVIEHFNARALEDLLGNPQTLALIAAVAKTGNLPETLSDLFERAIEILRQEHRTTKSSGELPRATGLGAAGAAFAGLILTGSTAIVRTSSANAAEDELQLTDVSVLPAGDSIEAMLGTRLFKADGADRFSYLHRRIGEYLGARWLAKQADTQAKRRRLFAMFHNYGLVPASLRGIHAWLARDPALAKEVIAADPMGVIEYGDADSLTVEQARWLITALELLAADNPYFCSWGPYSLRGIAQPEFIEDIRRLITDPATPFALSRLVLEALKGSKIASELVDDLHKIVLDQTTPFSSRAAAGEVLATQDFCAEYWLDILRTLLAYNDDLSIRLAIELTDDIGYAVIDDDLLAQLVVAHAQQDDHTIGVLFTLERHLPEARLGSILDRLVATAKMLGDEYEYSNNGVLTDFACHLIERAVTAGGVSAEKFWAWFELFDFSFGLYRNSYKKLETIIQSDEPFRQSIQRHLLHKQPPEQGDMQLWFQSIDRLPSLWSNDNDIVALLKELDPSDHSDQRWRDLVRLTPHSQTFARLPYPSQHTAQS